MHRLDFYADYEPFVRVRLDASRILLGRATDCTIQLQDERVSRRHAVIRPSDDGHELEDLSLNGTRVNDALVRSRTARLRSGDRIYIERFVIVYQREDETREERRGDGTLVAGAGWE